jgi:5-methylcytosine-specific restriction endonuclease McrA
MRNRWKYPKNWQQLRVIIIIRDKFCCTICGIHESKIKDAKGRRRSLHVMHLDGNTMNNKYTEDKNYFNNPDNNLASGCPKCHKLYDTQYNTSYKSNPKFKAEVVGFNMQTN